MSDTYSCPVSPFDILTLPPPSLLPFHPLVTSANTLVSLHLQLMKPQCWLKALNTSTFIMICLLQRCLDTWIRYISLSFRHFNIFFIIVFTIHHRIIKSRRLKWSGHLARMGEVRIAFKILTSKPTEKRLGMDNIKEVDVNWEIGLICSG